MLIINLTPTPDYIAERYGLDTSNEDADADAIASYQGADIQELSVEPGESFVITEDFEDGMPEYDGRPFILRLKDDAGKPVQRTLEKQDTLLPGRYLFHLDGKTIEKL